MKLFFARTRKRCKSRKTGNTELNFLIDIKPSLKCLSAINKSNGPFIQSWDKIRKVSCEWMKYILEVIFVAFA